VKIFVNVLAVFFTWTHVFGQISTTPLNEKNNSTAAALYNAVVRNDTVALKQTVASGVSINSKYQQGWQYCLHDAIKISRYEMARFILDHNFDVKLKGSKGMNALHIACSSVSPLWFVELLLKNEVNVNEVDDFGFTALHHAAFSANYELSKILLEHGANPRLQNIRHETAFDMASQIREKELAALIKSYLTQ
jgi:ankyrin repeat protein